MDHFIIPLVWDLARERLSGWSRQDLKGTGKGATFILDLPIHREQLAA